MAGATKSIFLSNIHHAFAQTDGTYKFPNSLEGDLLKQAMKEILHLTQPRFYCSRCTYIGFVTKDYEEAGECCPSCKTADHISELAPFPFMTMHLPEDVPMLCDICGKECDNPFHYSTPDNRHKHRCVTCQSKAEQEVLRFVQAQTNLGPELQTVLRENLWELYSR